MVEQSGSCACHPDNIHAITLRIRAGRVRLQRNPNPGHRRRGRGGDGNKQI